MSKPFNPSSYNLAVHKEFTTTGRNIVVQAKAGSGKSTMAIWLMSFVPSHQYIMYCAFNKSIADEFKGKCAHMKNASVSTIHGLGMKILNKAYKPEIVSTKYRKLLLDMANDWKEAPSTDDEPEFLDRVMDLVDKLRLFFCKTQEECLAVASKYDIATDHDEIGYAMRVIEAGRSIVTQIDFTDMIYLPLYYNLEPGFKYSVVIIDEAQDLNTCQRLLVMKFKRTDGKFIAIGDPNQAIYSFSGADAKSFQKFLSYPNTVEYPLSVNYRCPYEVIQYVRKATGVDILPHDGALQGKAVNLKASLHEVPKNDSMVLCRYNMPLAKLCIEYLMNGIKAYIKGKDIGENLCNLIKKADKVDMQATILWLEASLGKIKNKLLVKYRLPIADIEKMSEVVNMSDKIEAIRVITAGCKTSNDGTMKIRNIFQETGTGICLCTVHKAKGLEMDHVFIICDWLMPSAYAKTDEEKEQEENLRYVAYTRPTKSLNFILDFDPYKN